MYTGKRNPYQLSGGEQNDRFSTQFVSDNVVLKRLSFLMIPTPRTILLLSTMKIIVILK